MRRALAVFKTLRGRLVLLVCFATLPALLFTFYVASNERAAVLQRIEREARLLAHLASREHAHQLEGAKTLLHRLAGVLADEPAIGRADARCPAFFPPLLAGYPQFTTIGILSVRGDLLCSAHPAPAALSFAENSAFRRALESAEVEVGNYTVGPVVHRPVLHLAYAVRDAAGSPLLVVFVGLDLDWIDHAVQGAELPPEYALMVVDRQGRVLGRSQRASWPPEPAPENADLARLATATRPVVLDVPGSGRRFLVGAPIGSDGVSVVASLPLERVYGEANRVVYRTAAALTLLTILTIGCVLFAAEISILRVLRVLSRTARRFGEGDLATRADVPSAHGELADLTRAFNAMADALAARQRELAVAKETEAGRIARELHDELGQVLTSIKLDVAALQRAPALVPATAVAPAEAPGAALAEINRRIDDAVGAVRRISADLRPPVLDRLGLTAALQAQVRDFEQRTRLAIVLDVEVDEPVDWLAGIAIYRIVNEALTNVVRHADATEVSVDLRQSDGAYVLEVNDDGRGIAAAEADAAGSLGIAGMKERCLLLGGAFSISGRPGGGTTIVVSIPLHAQSAPDAAHPAR
ncbi:MAG TPA: ATP-binding protein [Anaeromyxobacteraceae bacterium]|nr:ATP-binding protein [Anaeromyxobacteraceae bacterium]